jgi:zinc protease
MRSTPVSREELDMEIGRAVESFPRRFATAALRASQFAGDDYNQVPADYWEKYRQRIQALKPDEIQRVAQKYLQPDKLIVLVVGDADAIQKGNPDKPEFKLGRATSIPLPDPLTMVYPK